MMIDQLVWEKIDLVRALKYLVAMLPLVVLFDPHPAPMILQETMCARSLSFAIKFADFLQRFVFCCSLLMSQEES